MTNSYYSDLINKSDIETVVKLLDGFAASEESRLKVIMDENLDEGQVKKEHHHGRCDIGSPWARGCEIGAEIE